MHVVPIALLGLDAATGWHLLALIWSGATSDTAIAVPDSVSHLVRSTD